MFTDPLLVASALVFAASMAIAAQAIIQLFKIRKQTPLSEIAPESSPIEALQGDVKRITDTIRTLEFSHLDALKILGQRLDHIEAQMQQVQQQLSKSSLDELSQPRVIPPPFV